MSDLIEPLNDAAVEGCSHCQMHKVPIRAQPGGRIPGPLPHRAGHHISFDVFTSPLVERDGQPYDQLYVVRDVLSNFAIAAPTLSVGFDSQRVVEVLCDSWIYPFGIPAQIRTDLGPQFVAEWFKAFWERAGAIHALSQAGRHQSNGTINVATTLDRTWVEIVKDCLRALHCLPAPTGYLPYQLMTGTQLAPLGEPPQGGVEEAPDMASFFRKRNEMGRLAVEAARKVHEEEEDRYNRRR